MGLDGADVAAYKWGHDYGDDYNFHHQYRHKFYYNIKMCTVDFVGQFEFELEKNLKFNIAITTFIIITMGLDISHNSYPHIKISIQMAYY